MPDKNGQYENRTPLISVVIPVYNVRNYLERCLRSVADQDYENFEALLIDDGSPDGSGEICEQWSKKDSRFKVFHKENGGISDARNYGLDRCTGEYISFVDSDDFVEKTYLSYLYGLIRRTEDCRISQANHIILRGEKKEINDEGNQDAVLTQHDVAAAVLFHDRVDVAPWGKLYHRSVFEGLRYPMGRLFEDTYLFGEILLRTDCYAYGHIPQYNYIKNPDSITTASFREKNLEYIEAAEHLAETIREKYPDLQAGCIRRVNHARLSVLRYMKNCEERYLPVRNRLRQEVLSESGQFIHLQRTPRRDKLAIALLRIGWNPFYLGWVFYTRIRNG